MTNGEDRRVPTQEEAVAADALAREFLERISAVPAEERNLLTSEKFAGPIAQPGKYDRATDAE